MAIFTDAYERTIDDKHRLQIPAPHRSVLEANSEPPEFYLALGERGNTLSLYPEKYFLWKMETMRTDEIPGMDALDFEQMYFSSASRVEMDKQGRIVVPERQRNLSGVDKTVVLAGANQRIDIWRKEDYEAFEREFVQRRSSLNQYMRPFRRGDEGSGGRVPANG